MIFAWPWWLSILFLAGAMVLILAAAWLSGRKE